MTFEFLKTERFEDSIDIEDIGNCSIDVINDDAKEWYLNIKTDLGWSEIKIFGPLNLDIDTLTSSFNYHYSNIEYNSQKLFKIINDFINDPKKEVTQVFELSQEEFKQRFEVIRDLL